MANDDRILLNLVLNEATISAVEGRVRNLVNRLNNQNISLNISGRNLDNIINRLNDIQQRMQTINSTPVNINANLTSAQQQYRLETERMRVSQQLELSRQRTLQTENQAISALAQQNRTLTVNNNVTHQIQQNTQNIGNNMNVAGGHARDFVDYLSDGVRYLVTYRSLYAIMNQIGEAFSEMKNVDTAAIQVRKTTGMSKDEIEAIKKASYGVATEYGRSASEYLESVSEFARAGYKQHSTELGKLSLLTQNVGDVSAESADKMLLAVDAAYQLEGNVTELTNVVNALNNIANKNPTSMQKMADGLQVSASMAKTAGMDISELTALIGTGTAVTQREGAEVARAIRTIIMNVKSVKGELEDGTIIDDESIAKAEAALKGVGISTKEVVNGVRELRNPMEVLRELSVKWHTLGTEAKSVLTESIANKRQANVLSGILDNWSMVEKMQSEYFNSANSAIEENILYLEGWEAKSKVVSAKWTEYISNLADAKVITGTLDALYGLLTALDTPIGRIATQIVLVNTALAVTGRLWQQIRARSIVAEILSIGVADRQLGTAIGIVTEHLGRQALAWATSPFGMATIAVAGITLITSAIEKNSQKLEENAQKAGEAYDKVKSNMNELDSLIKQYNDLQLSNEWNNTPVETKKQLHEDINRLLGDEADKIDILNGKYKETTEELFKQRMAKLPEEEKTAFDNEQAKGKTLWNDVALYGSTAKMRYSQDEDVQKIISRYSHVSTAPQDDDRFEFGAFKDFGDFMYKFDEVNKMLLELQQAGLGETQFYKQLNSDVVQFKSKVEEYRIAVEELEKTRAGQKLGNYITQNVGGYIDNLEEYNKVVDWVKNNFKGEDKNSALSFLNSYFSEYAEKVTETSDLLSGDYSSAIKSVSATLSTLQEKYDELKSAQDEYNSTGAISAETMQKLIDNDLLQYLDYSSGKLKINTDALLAEGEAAKVSAIQSLQKAMADDLMLLAEGKITEASPRAQKAVENLGIEMEDAGNKAKTSAGLLAGWAVSAQAAKDAAQGKLKDGFSVEDFNSQANAIISAYTSAANSIGGVTIKSPKSSSSGSSSSKNEVLDNYLKDAENRYKIHQDETKYIEELQHAHDNLTKDEKERLDIISKINEAYRDLADNRIKDLEHQIDLKKELYGEDYDSTVELSDIQRIAHEEAVRLRKMGYDDNSNEIQELQKTWWDAQNNKLDWRLNNSKNWIEERNRLGDWHLFNDSEVEAWERVVAWLKKEYPDAIDEIKEAEENLYDSRKELFEKETDYLSKRLGSQKTILQAYHDATNSIAEAQHEITKELEASKTMYEYLDEDTRKLLFNQEDYNTLVEELYDIQYKADKLQRQYQYDLENSTLYTVEEITANYEMQYETLMKSYEIAKADLDIAKKKQKLNNVLNERNVRMLINGQWQWVANTQDVIDAKSELADAEYAKRVAQAGLTQQNSINDLTKKQNQLGTVIDKFKDGVIVLETATKEVADLFKNLSFSSKSNSSDFGYSSGGGGSSSKGSAGYYNKNIDYTNAIANADSEDEVLKLNDERNNKIWQEGLSYTPMTNDEAIDHWKSERGYASGTKHALPGVADVNEGNRLEGLITKDGTLIPMANFEGGETVFNHEMIENLWHQAQIPWNVYTPNLPDFVTKQSSVADNSVHIDKVDVHNPVDLNGFLQELNTKVRSQNAITNRM